MKKPPLVFLLALWGERYIDHFFAYSLPTLLASGNIPALGQKFECSFLFLTKKENFAYFKTLPSYPVLASYCSIECLDISDLIFENHYATTLTLAYDRGMKSRKKSLCDTFFFYLVADLIFADGALKNLIPYLLEDGYSAITAGSFSVIEESFIEILKRKENGGIITFTPYELLSYAFEHLHPVTMSQTLTQQSTHTDHSNRLFWKAHEGVMVGRFYLRHMYCIKPEIDNYVIGSSCDYSFIPELCPSGKVMAIRDSNDFCAIEMAPKAYGHDHLHQGPLREDTLVKRLGEWTTSIHRANAHLPIVFHNHDLDTLPQETLEKSAAFIQKIETLLPQTAHPIRGHYYWLSAIDSILHQILHHKEKTSFFAEGTCAGLVGSATFLPRFGREDDDRFLIDRYLPPLPLGLSKKGIRKDLRKKRLTHCVEWFDLTTLKKGLKKRISLPTLTIVFEPILPLLSSSSTLYQHYELFMRRTPESLREVFAGIHHVVIMAKEFHFDSFEEVLALCAQYMPPGSTLSLLIKNEKPLSKKALTQRLAIFYTFLQDAGIVCEEQHLESSLSHMFLQGLFERSMSLSFSPNRSLWSRLWGHLSLILLNGPSWTCNILNWIGVIPKMRCTSARFLFRKN